MHAVKAAILATIIGLGWLVPAELLIRWIDTPVSIATYKVEGPSRVEKNGAKCALVKSEPAHSLYRCKLKLDDSISNVESETGGQVTGIFNYSFESSILPGISSQLIHLAYAFMVSLVLFFQFSSAPYSSKVRKAAFAYAAVLFVLFYSVGKLYFFDSNETNNVSVSAGARTLSLLGALLVAPITEELIYRAAIFDPLRVRFSASTTIIITSALFSAGHFFSASGFSELSISSFAFFLLAGLSLGLVKEKEGLLACIASHFSMNFGLWLAKLT